MSCCISFLPTPEGVKNASGSLKLSCQGPFCLTGNRGRCFVKNECVEFRHGQVGSAFEFSKIDVFKLTNLLISAAFKHPFGQRVPQYPP